MRLGALSYVAAASAITLACVNGRFYHDPNSEEEGGKTGSGGSTSGGSSSGGHTSSGGTSSGGAQNSSGGSANGGTQNMSGGGGNTSGGNNSGGASRGGNSSGGSTSGGSNSGGVIGRGGTGNGGSTGSGGNTAKGGTGSGGTGSGGTGSGGSNVVQPPPITGGSSAWASRYWDCCKPACGWSGNVRSGSPMKACSQSNQVLGDNNAKNACEGGGSAFMCWSGVPWAASDTLAYGFAAASGGNYVCGRCYQVQFTGQGHGGSPASPQLNGKTMIIQVINNGGVAADQFDILIPGGGVGDFNACSTQWGTSDLGKQYGGFLGGCNGDKNCVKTKCQTVFNGKPDLLAGCDWFLNWFGGADNPSFVYKQIACPAAITQKSGLSDPG